MKTVVNKKFVAENAAARRITGQGMTEYIIIVALIALAAIAAVSYFGSTVQAQFTQMGNTLVGDTTGQTAQDMTTGNVSQPKAATLGDYSQ